MPKRLFCFSQFHIIPSCKHILSLCLYFIRVLVPFKTVVEMHCKLLAGVRCVRCPSCSLQLGSMGQPAAASHPAAFSCHLTLRLKKPPCSPPRWPPPDHHQISVLSEKRQRQTGASGFSSPVFRKTLLLQLKVKSAHSLPTGITTHTSARLHSEKKIFEYRDTSDESKTVIY